MSEVGGHRKATDGGFRGDQGAGDGGGAGRGGDAPPACGVRTPWEAVPASVREAVQGSLGARVLGAETQRSGFSPGVAARLRLADGRRAFVKAVSGARNPESPGIHRDEIRIARALPASVPAPRLLADIERDGWVVLLFEDVEGWPPAQPWLPRELDLVLGAVGELARTLTPSPVDAPPVTVRDASFHGWRTLAASHTAGADDLAGLDPWAARNLDALAALESGWTRAAAGDTLAHGDLRADNVLLTPDGRVVLVDWPWACRAAPWYDLVLLLPSVHMQGGPPPQQLLAGHPAADGADPDAVTALLAALAGFLLGHARRPAPPGLPTLRAFQAAYGRAALEWLRGRLGC